MSRSVGRAKFSVPDLQCVPSGYLLTYGEFMLLGGRAADLLGRRRVLVAGVAVIGISSLIGGLAQSSGVLIGARVAEGRGIGYEDPPPRCEFRTGGSREAPRALSRRPRNAHLVRQRSHTDGLVAEHVQNRRSPSRASLKASA